VIFTLILFTTRIPLPQARQLPMLALYGLLAFGVSYALLYVGMQQVPAGVAAVVMGVVPLLTLLLARVQHLEELHLRALAGALVAFAGSAAMFAQPEDVDFGWLRLGAVCLAAVSASESVVIAKRCGPQHPVVMNAVGMSIGALALLTGSLMLGETWALPRQPAKVLAFGYLVLSSVALFVLVLVVVRHWTASASSYIFVLMPPGAVVFGAALGGEAITIPTVLGGLGVLTGVYIGALRRRPVSPPDS